MLIGYNANMAAAEFDCLGILENDAVFGQLLTVLFLWHPLKLTLTAEPFFEGQLTLANGVEDFP